MRFARLVGTCAITLSLAGCLSPSSSGPPRAQPTGNPRPFWDQPGPRGNGGNPSPSVNIPGPGGRDAKPPASPNSGDTSGVFAGQLIDAFNRRPPNAYIQVVPAAEPGARAIDVAADQNGYFVIQGLRPGLAYLLTARATVDGRTLAGRVQATPPQPRLLIKLSEELASGTVPPIPAPPNTGPATPASVNPAAPSGGVAPAAADSGWKGEPGGAPDPDPPPQAGATPSGSTRIVPVRPEGIAEGPSEARPPILNLPALGPPPPAPPADPPPNSDPSGFRGPDSVMVPSCRFTGNRLENFALNDLEGRPWQFRQRSGRLMLLDFWGTWCTPCIQAIPHLVNLQKRHGAYGLEVVGVACERSGPQESVRRVRDVQRRFNMNYRVLLADLGDRCPLQAQLGIEQFPTLILVDSEGRIVWRGVGSDRLAELDAAIHHHLRR